MVSDDPLREALDRATPPERLASLLPEAGLCLRGMLARHPNLDAERVGLLAHDPSPGIRAAVAARRAGAPPPSHLADDEHPAVRLAIARNPTYSESLSHLTSDPYESVRRAVAAHPTTGTAKEALLHDTSRRVRKALAANEKAEARLLELLLTDPDASVRAAAAENPSTPPARLALLRALAGDVWLARDERWRARNVRLEADEYAWLAHSGPWGRALAAASTPVSAAALEALTSNAEDDVRALVAANESTPPEISRRLVRDPSPKVRAALAWTSPSGDVLSELAGDPLPAVRAAVAANRAVEPALVERLFDDADEMVRKAAFQNPALPAARAEGALGLYSRRDRRAGLSEQAWRSIAQLGHPVDAACYGPLSVSRELASHDNAEVRRALAVRGDASDIARLVGDPSARVRSSAAENSKAGPTALSTFAADESFEVRYRVARHQGTPPEALAMLARDREVQVRRGVAENPGASPSLLAALAEDQEPQVRAAAARHPSTPAAVRERLVLDLHPHARGGIADNPLTAPATLHRLTHDPDRYVRRTVAQRRDAPAEVLADLARDPEPEVRLWVALNPGLSEALVDVLGRDERREVRTAVVERRARALREQLRQKT